MDDAQLIRQFRNGDPESFNRLANRWKDRIHRFAYRYFADRDEAAEITQKTLINAYQKIDLLRDEGRFSPWIYRIATNLCIDETRKNGRKKTTPIDSLADSEEAAEHGTPATRLEQRELGELLQKALLLIPEEQRAVIILKEYEGLKFREIADALDQPLNTVKSRMYYGLQALRKVFQHWNIEMEALYDNEK
ncbi:MAG: sigma-70 family RNA polymerase sigma factor [Balneolaceae bacterium]